MDDFFDKMVDRVTKVSPLHSDLDAATLEKAGQVASPFRTSLKPLLPLASISHRRVPSSLLSPPHQHSASVGFASPCIAWAGYGLRFNGKPIWGDHMHVQATTEVESNKRPVLICPAQFGEAKDYESLKTTLEAKGHPVYIAKLARLDWLRIVPSVFTSAYWTSNLRPSVAMAFFLRED